MIESSPKRYTVVTRPFGLLKPKKAAHAGGAPSPLTTFALSITTEETTAPVATASTPHQMRELPRIVPTENWADVVEDELDAKLLDEMPPLERTPSRLPQFGCLLRDYRPTSSLADSPVPMKQQGSLPAARSIQKFRRGTGKVITRTVTNFAPSMDIESQLDSPKRIAWLTSMRPKRAPVAQAQPSSQAAVPFELAIAGTTFPDFTKLETIALVGRLAFDEGKTPLQILEYFTSLGYSRYVIHAGCRHDFMISLIPVLGRLREQRPGAGPKDRKSFMLKAFRELQRS